MTRTDPAGTRGQLSSSVAGNDLPTLRDVSEASEHPEQVPLFDTGRAKKHINRDGSLVRSPATSFDAIPSPKAITRGQRVVLSAVTIAGRGGRLLTLEDIVEAVRKTFPRIKMSSSGVRSRVAELTRKGSLVVVDERETTSHGRRCRRFRRAG